MNNEQINTQTYEKAWSAPVGALTLPDPVWFDIKSQLKGNNLLEIGAGIKPSIPIAGNHFLDISPTGVKKLEAKGGIGKIASVLNTGYNEGFFDGVFAFEIFEHVEQDLFAMLEVKRILKDDGLLVFSVPAHMRYWTAWDEMATHVRRYDPRELAEKLHLAGFEIVKYRPRFGPISKWSVAVPVWLNKKLPNLSMTFIHYAGYYPSRVLGRVLPIKWQPGPELVIPKNATGLTIVAKKS